jgi:hypothetical protein
MVEAIVSLGVLSGLGLIWFTYQNQDLRIRQRAVSLLSAVTEHRALSAWVESIPKERAVVASKLKLTAQSSGGDFCYPHPYSVLSGGDNCVNVQFTASEQVPGLDMSFSTALKRWQELSNSVIEWAARSKSALGQNQIELDQAYFTSDVLPKLTSAGCMNCHGPGGLSNFSGCTSSPGAHRVRTYPAALVALNSWNTVIGLSQAVHNGHPQGRGQASFQCFDEISKPFKARQPNGTLYRDETEALADVMLVGAPLGAMLLQPEFMIKDFGASSRLVESTVAFKARRMTTSVPARRQRTLTLDATECGCPIRPSTDYATGYSCTTRLKSPPAQAGGEAGAGPPPGYFCRYGEEFVPNSCTDTCSSYATPPQCSCGKGCSQPCHAPKCNKFTSTYACYSSVGIDEKVYSNRPADSPLLGNYSTLPNTDEVGVAMSQCLAIDQAEGSCGAKFCSDPSMANVTSGVCIEDRVDYGGYCRVKCNQGTYVNVRCGKGCTTQRWSGCAKIQIRHLCMEILPPTSLSSDVVEYMIRTSVFKFAPNQPSQRTLDGTHSIQGVIGP